MTSNSDDWIAVEFKVSIPPTEGLTDIDEICEQIDALGWCVESAIIID
tara:strand:- start:2930 stop:3073 length:144 start_codon:yes stop_codon:yes gene_type:complete